MYIFVHKFKRSKKKKKKTVEELTRIEYLIQEKKNSFAFIFADFDISKERHFSKFSAATEKKKH